MGNCASGGEGRLNLGQNLWRAALVQGLAIVAMWTVLPVCKGQERFILTGSVVDSGTGRLIPARVYIQSEDGSYFFPRSTDGGSAVEYRETAAKRSVEMHTTLSAHPFTASLPPGRYRFRVERGKEYLPHSEGFDIVRAPLSVQVRLKRWINMAGLGWYSGETHIHRDVDELPNVMLAEDLNVALPLSFWAFDAYGTPSSVPIQWGQMVKPESKIPRVVSSDLIQVDPEHVICSMNTEYEIDTVHSEDHLLGAVFALNHREPLKQVALPVRQLAEEVHQRGGLLELDKHNWPWSMMLVPIMQVDLYELANNHMWPVKFQVRKFGEEPAPYMSVERDDLGLTEMGWIQFTLENYYTLLNCGFRLRPTAGTASGGYPVPLGFSRVYVHLPDGFSYDRWIDGLNQGRSFVTTGPMLVVRVDGEWPGCVIHQVAEDGESHRITGWARSAGPLSRIEIVSEGRVVRTLEAANLPVPGGGYRSPIEVGMEVDSSTWIAVRCYGSGKEKARFAHTAPFFIDVPGRPLHPRREEIDYLIHRVETQLQRNQGALQQEALQEYRTALAVYRTIAKTAR